MAKAIHTLKPLDGEEQFINLNHIETLEIYRHTPHKWVPRKRSLLECLFGSSRFADELVPDGEPFWCYRLTLASGRVIHMKEDRLFYAAWHALLA